MRAALRRVNAVYREQVCVEIEGETLRKNLWSLNSEMAKAKNAEWAKFHEKSDT
jgi:hypothetical protein